MDYYLCVMDDLMEMCDFSDEKVYDMESTLDLILEQFQEASDPAYKVLPALDVMDIASYIRTLDRKGIIMKLVHGLLYPEKDRLPESLVLTVYQYEQAVADFIAGALKEKADDQSRSV
jgi:NTE family protein